uniref:(northern house mosquito) hypothetical protein n=1 Tax=Culex pipiens TaxID=7175 RepID=A0A8D8FG32_CULPI
MVSRITTSTTTSRLRLRRRTTTASNISSRSSNTVINTGSVFNSPPTINPGTPRRTTMTGWWTTSPRSTWSTTVAPQAPAAAEPTTTWAHPRPPRTTSWWLRCARTAAPSVPSRLRC